MNAVKIVEVGNIREVKTKYGTKKMVQLTFRDVSMQDEKYNVKASYFLTNEEYDTGFPFSEGDEVIVDVIKNGEYNNIKKISPFGDKKPTPSPKPQVVEKAPDWDAKDRRIVSQNSIGNAVELVKHDIDKPLEERIDLVLKTADRFFKWVYRG